MTRDYRLVVPAIAAWVAAGVFTGLPMSGGRDAMVVTALILAVGGIGLLVAAVVCRHSSARGILALGAVTLAVAALVSVAATAKLPSRYPAEASAAAESGRQVEITVVATERVSVGGPWRATMRVLTVGTEAIGVESPVLVFDGAPALGAELGSTLTLSGTMAATEPGDSVAYLVFATGPASVDLEPEGLIAWANALRSGFADAAQSLPGDGGQLLPGLAIGDTRAVSEGLDSAMKTSSLSHLTAVSGANCAIVIALMMLAGAAMGMARGLRIAASLVVLLVFVVLVTPEPSVVRAATMATIVLLALLIGRPVAGVAVVGLAVIALIVADPWLARNYGFALSVLATTGLLVLARPLASRLSRVMPPAVALIVSVPLAAQLACQPVLILLSPSIPVYGVLANIVAGPAAPVATVVGLAACMLLPVAPWLGAAAAWMAWIPASWVASVAQFSAGMPFARVPWPEGIPGLVLLVVVTAAVLGLVLLQSRPLLRVVSAATAVSVVGGIVISAGAAQWATSLDRPAGWQIAVCDVGQGDAVVVRSAGSVALIDTGREPMLVAECLSELGITHIQLLVLTHFDLDHVGGTDAVVGIVDRALVGPGAGVDDDVLVDIVSSGGATVDRASSGMQGTLGELRWRVLWPPDRLRGFDPGNDSSVTIEFEAIGECVEGCLSSLFLADLGESSQAAMMRAHTLRHVDVVKVAHHGSADQNPALYERVRAAVGVIGVGVDNGYGHPTAETLDTLASVGATVTRTDTQGMALLTPGATPGSVAVWTERSGDGRGG